jgi:hypothetical protein
MILPPWIKNINIIAAQAPYREFAAAISDGEPGFEYP